MLSFRKLRYIGVYVIEDTVNSRYLIGKSFDCQRSVKAITEKCGRGAYLNKAFQLSYNEHGKLKFKAYVIREVISYYLNDPNDPTDPNDYSEKLDDQYDKVIRKFKRQKKSLYNVDTTTKGIIVLTSKGKEFAEFRTQQEAATFLKTSRVTLNKALKLNGRNVRTNVNGKYPLFYSDYNNKKPNLKIFL